MRGPVAGCDVVWSNFFFKSFTLGWLLPLKPLFVADLVLAPSPADLSSTGFDAERKPGRVAIRLPGAPGCFGVVPVPFARDEEEGWRLPETAEAMGSRTGEERRVMFVFVCTPR